jgi:hypothetical protein
LASLGKIAVQYWTISVKEGGGVVLAVFGARNDLF